MSAQNLPEGFNPHDLKISLHSVKRENIIPLKEKSSKTMFKMPEFAFDCINKLAKIEGINSTKGALDTIAKFAEESCKAKTLIFYDTPESSKYKSVTISAAAKDTFSRLAKANDKSRDNILFSAIINLMEKVRVKDLSKEEKVKYAAALINMAEKMIAIFDSQEFVEAREKLLACNDPDFGDFNNFQNCGDLLAALGQIYELPYALKEFINIKERENEDL